MSELQALIDGQKPTSRPANELDDLLRTTAPPATKPAQEQPNEILGIPIEERPLDRLMAERPDDPRLKILATLEAKKKAITAELESAKKAGIVSKEATPPLEFYQTENDIEDVVRSIVDEYRMLDDMEKAKREEAPGFLEGWLQGVAALQRAPQTIGQMDDIGEKAHAAAGMILLGVSSTPIGKGFGLRAEIASAAINAVSPGTIKRMSVYDKDLPLGAGEMLVGSSLLDKIGWEDDGSALRGALAIAIDMAVASPLAPIFGKAATKPAAKLRAADGAIATGSKIVKRFGEIGQMNAQAEIAAQLDMLSRGKITFDQFKAKVKPAFAVAGLGKRELGFWSRCLDQPLYEGLKPEHFTNQFYGTVRTGQAAWGIKYNAITDNPLFRIAAKLGDSVGIYGPSNYIAAHKDTILLPLFGSKSMKGVATIAQGVRLMSRAGEKPAAAYIDILSNPEASRAFRDMLTTSAKEMTPQSARTTKAFNAAMNGLAHDQFVGILGDAAAGQFGTWKFRTPAEKFDLIQEALRRKPADGGMSRLEAEAAYMKLVGPNAGRLERAVADLHLAEDKLVALEKAGADPKEISVARAEVWSLNRDVKEATNIDGLEALFQAHPWLRRDLGNPPIQGRVTSRSPMPNEPFVGLGAMRTPKGERNIVSAETIIPSRGASEEFSTIWSPSRVEDFITSSMVRASGQADIASKWAAGMLKAEAAVINHVPVILREPAKGALEILSAAFSRTFGLAPKFNALRTSLEAQGALATTKTLDTLREMSNIYGKLPKDAQEMIRAAQQLDLPYLNLKGPSAAPTPDRARTLANTAQRALDLLTENEIKVSTGTWRTLERATRMSVGADPTDVAFASHISRRVDERMFTKWLGDREPTDALRKAFEVEKGLNVDRSGRVLSSLMPTDVQFKGGVKEGVKPRPWYEGDLVSVDLEGWAGMHQEATKEVLRDVMREMGASFGAIQQAREALLAHGGPVAKNLVSKMDGMRMDLLRKERLLGYSRYPGDFFPEEITAAGIKRIQLRFGSDPKYRSLFATEGNAPLTTREINRRIKSGKAPYSLYAELENDKDWLASIRGSKLEPYFSEEPIERLAARALTLGKATTYADIAREGLRIFGKEVPIKGMDHKSFANSLSLAMAETRDPVIMAGGASGRYRIMDSLDMALSIHQKDPTARVTVVDRRIAGAIEDLRTSWADKAGDVWKDVTKLPVVHYAFDYQDLFKKWGLLALGYHIRNFTQGLLVNYLMGTTPATIGACIRGWADPNYLIYTPTGPITFKDALNLFRDQGVNRSMLGAATPTAATEADISELRRTLTPSRWQKFWDVVPGANRSVAEAQEFIVRFPGFVQLLRSGEAPAYAANKARHYFFDNSNLTNFEKNFMGSWVPWYNWFRNTIAFGFKEGFENPGTLLKYMVGVNVGSTAAKELIKQTVKPWHQEDGKYVSAPKWADQNVPYQLFKYLRNGDLGRQNLIWLGFDGREGSKSFGDCYYVNTEGQNYMHDFVRAFKAAVAAGTPWGEGQEHGVQFMFERLGPHVQLPLTWAGVNPRRPGTNLPGPEQRSNYMNMALIQQPNVKPIPFGKRFEIGHQADIAFEAGNVLGGAGFVVRDNVETAINWANSLGYAGLVLNSPVIRTLPFTRMVNELTDESRTWAATAWREAGLTISSINIVNEMRNYRLGMMADINELKGTPRRETVYRHNKKLQSVIDRVSDADLAKHPAIVALRERLESDFKDYLELEKEFLQTKKVDFVPRQRGK